MDIRLILIQVFVVLFAITIPMLTKNFTSDFGTHIAIGRHIVQTKAIPETEFLNYTSLGMKNFYGEWGFQAVLYGVYALGGIYGVSLLCWGIVFCVYLLLHRSNVLRGANVLVSVFAIFAFSGFVRIRIQPRPEIFNTCSSRQRFTSSRSISSGPERRSCLRFRF